jgi:hypothetical protein
MGEQAVREHAVAYCEALLAGDIERAAQEMSNELRANLGQVVAKLPMPCTEATALPLSCFVRLAVHADNGADVVVREVAKRLADELARLGRHRHGGILGVEEGESQVEVLL